MIDPKDAEVISRWEDHLEEQEQAMGDIRYCVRPCFHPDFMNLDGTPGDCDDHSGDEDDKDACCRKMEEGNGWRGCLSGSRNGRLYVYKNALAAAQKKEGGEG